MRQARLVAVLAVVLAVSSGCGDPVEREAGSLCGHFERALAGDEEKPHHRVVEDRAQRRNDIDATALRDALNAECSEAYAAYIQLPSEEDADLEVRLEALEEFERDEPEESDRAPAEGLAGMRSACERGEMVACDDLYMESPWGSDDEEFGATCGNRRSDRAEGVWCEDVFGPSGTESHDSGEMNDTFLVLEAVWSRTTSVERSILCAEARKGRSEALAVGRQVADASNETVTASEAAAFLRTVC